MALPGKRHTADAPSPHEARARREDVEPALIPERVMVCMSSNTHASRVISTGARIAAWLGSQWYAVYVETPRERPERIDPRDADALEQNIRLRAQRQEPPGAPLAWIHARSVSRERARRGRPGGAAERAVAHLII